MESKFAEYYSITSAGDVISTNPNNPRRGQPYRIKPFLFKQSGYLQVLLPIDGKPKYFYVHRLVAQAFIPNPDNKPQVNHINGIKTDNRVENLEWATGSENQRHAVANGLKMLGENRPDSKFTNKQVRYVRENPDNLTGRELAAQFGVHENTISKIQLGQTYKSVGGVIRPSKVNRTPPEICDEIRRLYVRKSSQFNSVALAKKFNITPSTVSRIINNN